HRAPHGKRGTTRSSPRSSLHYGGSLYQGQDARRSSAQVYGGGSDRQARRTALPSLERSNSAGAARRPRRPRAEARSRRRNATGGYFDQAVRIAKTLPHVSSRTEVLADVADKYMAVGHYDQAEQTAAMIEDPVSRAAVLAKIAWRYLAAGQYDRAFRMVDAIA